MTPRNKATLALFLVIAGVAVLSIDPMPNHFYIPGLLAISIAFGVCFSIIISNREVNK